MILSREKGLFGQMAQMNISVKTIGEELQPVIVIDNFHPSPKDLIEAAKHQHFVADNVFFPGVRAPTPTNYSEYLDLTIMETARSHFGLKNHSITSMLAKYACVTLPPERLHPLQTIPHFDSNDPTQLACIHYLCNPNLGCGGTAFYQHRKTGYEHIDQERVITYKQTLIDEFKANKLKISPQYICGDNEMFSQIHSEEAKYNRLVIYRSTSLHSGSITNDYLFGGSPANGRLTITSFIQLSEGKCV